MHDAQNFRYFAAKYILHVESSLKNAALNDVYVLTYRYYTIYKFDSFLLKNSWQFIGPIGVVVLIICTKRVTQEIEIVLLDCRSHQSFC